MKKYIFVWINLAWYSIILLRKLLVKNLEQILSNSTNTIFSLLKRIFIKNETNLVLAHVCFFSPFPLPIIKALPHRVEYIQVINHSFYPFYNILPDEGLQDYTVTLKIYIYTYYIILGIIIQLS